MARIQSGVKSFVSSSQVIPSPGSITAKEQFTRSVIPVQILEKIGGVLPTNGQEEGDTCVCVDDGMLYRFHSGAWTNLTPTSVLSGKIQYGQIEANSITANELAADSVIFGKIAAGAVSIDCLTFAPVLGSNVISFINASSEGLTINTAKLNLTGVLHVGGAAADVNQGSTTISGSKLTTGTVTADSVVAGASISAPTIKDSSGNTVLSTPHGSVTLTANFGYINSVISTQMTSENGLMIGTPGNSITVVDSNGRFVSSAGIVMGGGIQCSGDISTSGNIAVGGTVDGVDVSALNSTVSNHTGSNTKHVNFHNSTGYVFTSDVGGVRRIGWYDGANSFAVALTQI